MAEDDTTIIGLDLNSSDPSKNKVITYTYGNSNVVELVDHLEQTLTLQQRIREMAERFETQSITWEKTNMGPIRGHTADLIIKDLIGEPNKPFIEKVIDRLRKFHSKLLHP